MRTAALSGLLVSCAYLVIHLPRLLSNADFLWMCVGSAMLFDGKLPANPYFPPGYPALLWLLMHLELSALTSGAILAAIGIGLTAGAVTYAARLWQIPAAPAFMLGVLTCTLPTVFIVALNPHLDALYAGLGAVLLACAMRALARPPTPWVYVTALLCTVLLVSFRYHAAFVVLPVALVMLFSRAKGARVFGLTLLLVGFSAIGASYYALHVATGSYHTAGLDQVRTGAAYREYGSEAEISRHVFDDYAGWQRSYRPADARMIVDGVIANWPQYITRKSIIGGTLLWLLGLLIRRRQVPGAHWLLLFILGYTLAISPAYYITRASALPEAAGMLLACAGLAALFFMPQSQPRGKRSKPPKLDPALVGAVLSMLALAGLGYNAWRELPIAQYQLYRAQLARSVNREALAVVGGNRRFLYGPIHSTGIYGTGPFNLPGVCWSRLWMDDPAVAAQVAEYLPKSTPEDVVAGKTRCTSVLIWTSDGALPSRRMLALLEHNPGWQEVPLSQYQNEARLWRRRMANGE